MAAVGCMAIRRDRQVQGDAITGPRTRPRPAGDTHTDEIAVAKLTVSPVHQRTCGCLPQEVYRHAETPAQAFQVQPLAFAIVAVTR
jgi:hypothetical protein